MKKYSIPVIGLLVGTVFLVTLLLRMIPAMHSLELKTIDWRFRWRGPLDVKNTPVVLVTIDDQSIESLPERWPWPRSYYAHVIENLHKAGARVVGLDVILDIPDNSRPQEDSLLADIISRSGNVVLTGKLEERRSPGRFDSYIYPVKPAPVFLQADSAWGTTAISADPDGIYRQYIVLQKSRGVVYPSLGLEILKSYMEIPASVQPAVANHKLVYGRLQIPLLNDNLMMINYAGPAGTFPAYSFDSVIDDENFDLGEDYDLDYFSKELLPAGVFRDKIVLIGSTISEQHDNFPTPFFEFTGREGRLHKAQTPGVEIHANALYTILNRAYIRFLPPSLLLIVLLVIILLIYLLTLRLSTGWAVLLVLISIAGYTLSQFLLFSGSRVIMEMVAPNIAILLSFSVANAHQFVVTKREKKMIVGAFERFLPRSVIGEILDHPEKLQLGGEERNISVMFTDLVNFTTVSEQLSPKDLVQLINYYLTEMTEIVFKHNGIIDKYEGDGIMAEFGAPVFYDDHAVNACFAALDMQEKVRKLNLSKFKPHVSRLNCRIGVNSGPMIVGNMGSKTVFDYTVMGDAVNLAARLESANKVFGTSIMISYETYLLAKDRVVVRPLDLIRVKGKNKPVRVFEVLGRKDSKIPPDIQTILPVFITGIKYYHRQDWQNALSCFKFCLSRIPGDGPSAVYLSRIHQYTQDPPPPDWDGVFTMTAK